MPVLTRPTTSTSPSVDQASPGQASPGQASPGQASVGQSWRRRGIAALTLAFGLALAPFMTAGSAQAEVVHHRVAHHRHHHHHVHHAHHVVHHAPVHHPHG